MKDAKQMMAQSKFYMGYSRWLESEQRNETWEESVARVMQMHREKYADKASDALEALFEEARLAYANKEILGAQRALQFGGEQIFKHEARMYNCSSSHVDRIEFFQECMYLLLCGCGVGFSVQKHHVAQLPTIKRRSIDAKTFVVTDDIEGWANAFGVLMSSFATGVVPFPEYQGKTVHFDFSQIRPRGAFISGGFKAPGPEGLSIALNRCEALLNSQLTDKEEVAIRPIIAYDFVMHMSDAVLSGGVRRSATICLFSIDDLEMMTAKTGDWFVKHPHRARSNNSVVLVRDEVTREQFSAIMKSVKDFGEPGFVFVEDKEFTVNPCVEIGMLPKTADGRSGFQFCNLTEINGGAVNSLEDFIRVCRASAILGTLQAGYTNFQYVSSATKEITDREALIGASITGWMNSPEILFDEEVLRQGAEVIKQVNKEVAALIGINPAARTTCVKPSGNASVLLGTASGIHGEHAERYFRNVQMTTTDDVLDVIEAKNPHMTEISVWSANGTDKVVSFPIISKPGSIYKHDLLGVKQLEYVRKAQQTWVEFGTDESLCVDKRLRHNVSNTISVDNWDDVEEYIFNHRRDFAGISLLAASGDKAYPQAPFTEVFTAEQLLTKYGAAVMFASGLIVDGLHAFNNDLWRACNTALGYGENLTDASVLKIDWVRRAEKFAKNYFGGNIEKCTFCLKDVYNLHKWTKIYNNLVDVNFIEELTEKQYTDVDSMGAQGCAGGGCEFTF